MDDMAVVKSHNPFAVNDAVFSKVTVLRLEEDEPNRLVSGVGASARAHDERSSLRLLRKRWSSAADTFWSWHVPPAISRSQPSLRLNKERPWKKH